MKYQNSTIIEMTVCEGLLDCVILIRETNCRNREKKKKPKATFSV